MEFTPLSVTGVLLLSSTLIYIFVVVTKTSGFRKDPKPEPYRIPSIVPYIGHLVGLIWYRNRYYSKLSARYDNLPIYTLPILNGQIYVINEPDLVLAAQRQPKIISFWQVEATATAALGAVSITAGNKLKSNLSPRHDEDKLQGKGLLLEGLNATHQAMAPGPGFQRMLLAASQTIAEDLNTLSEKGAAQRRVDLWQWVKHEVTHATTESVYGPMNPYRDLAVENGFWDFANDTLLLFSGPAFSRFLAPKGCEGRARVVTAFLEYFSKRGHESGSDLVKARLKVMEPEIAPTDIAGLECVNGQAILVNSVPTAFWTLWQVFSDCKILDAVRGEVDAITNVEEGRNTITLHNLKDLPLLASTIQETLRHRSCGIGARIILEDTVLADRHCLKKGSYVMFDNRALHLHKPTWGADGKTFDMRRFVKPADQRKIQRSGAFRGFGGGANLCPGKDFASLEVMALVAMFVARFDMLPDTGQWNDPRQDLSNVSLAIAPPRSKVYVQIVERKSLEGAEWGFGA